MATSTSAALAARIAELEAENAELRARDAAAPAVEAPATASKPRSRGWSVLSAILIVLGLVLGSLSVITTYAKNQLTDTELFVATFAPLADDPEVQAVVTDAVTGAIEESVDIPALTSTVFDGLAGLDLPPRAASALSLLQGPIAQGLQSLVRGVVDDFVTSPAFATVWATTLRTTHTQVLATMQDDPSAAVTISSAGELELQLGPIIAEVRTRLLANGVSFAEAIPAVDRSIVIVKDASLGSLTTLYALLVAVGSWLPILALALLTAGVLTARRKRRALITTALAAGILMAFLGIALAIGRVIAAGAIARTDGPVTRSAAEVIYDAVTVAAANTMLAIGALAVATVIVAVFSGPSRPAVWMREASGTAAAAVRSAGDRRGVSTGATGRWLDRHHALVLAAIAVVAAAVLLLSRPLSIGTVIVTAVIAVLVVAIVQLLRRPENAEEAGPIVDSPAGGDAESNAGAEADTAIVEQPAASTS